MRAVDGRSGDGAAAADGGQVVVVADASLAAVQALIPDRDPAGHARAELAARAEVGFPPATRMAALEGAPATVEDAGEMLDLPPEAVLLVRCPSWGIPRASGNGC